MKSNVLDNSAIRNCTGCGICASVCGKGAISIKLDDDGFYRPIVDEEKCVECGVCKKSCYKFDLSFKMSDKFVACYAAINKNLYQLSKSSSGGLSRLLMEECLARGYKVFGCKYNFATEDAQSVIVSSINSLDDFYGSKYFQSYTVNSFNTILKDSSCQKYAIFGTPCQIYAFSQTKKYLRDRDNYFLVDIFCHGCPSLYLWKSYLASIKKTYDKVHFDNISFRTKKYGWHEYCIDFQVDNKNIYSKKGNDPFFDIFFGADIMNEACYNCKARSSMAYTDIRIGDFWGPKYELNDKGVSAVVVSSRLGVDLFNSIKDKLTIEIADFNEIVSAQSYGRTVLYSKTRRNFLLQNITDCDDLFHLHQQYIKLLPLKVRFKKYLKNVVKHLPQKLYFIIRKTVHIMCYYKNITKQN